MSTKTLAKTKPVVTAPAPKLTPPPTAPAPIEAGSSIENIVDDALKLNRDVPRVGTKPRGRPPKVASAPTAPAAPGSTPTTAPGVTPLQIVNMTKDFEGWLRASGDVPAGMTGWDGWKLSDDEIKTGAKAIEAFRAKYYPNFGAGPESASIVLVMTLSSIFGPRAYFFYKWKQEEAQKAALKKQQEAASDKSK